MRIQHCSNVVLFSILNIKQGQKAAQAALIAAEGQMGCIKGVKWERMRVNLFQKASCFVYERSLPCAAAEPAQGRTGLAPPPRRQHLGPWGNASVGSGWESRVASWLHAVGTAALILLPGLGPCPGAHPVPRLSCVSERRAGDRFLVTSEASHAQPS